MNPHYHFTPHHEPTPPSTSGPHYTLPGGLVIVVVVNQHRCCPPSPPLLPSRGWLLLGATCRHRHPHHCRPTPPQPYQRRNRCCLTPVLLPPRGRRRALSALLIAHGAILDRHAASTPSGTTRRVPLPPAPPFSKDGTIAPAPPSWPPRCLGLLSGGWR